MEISKFFKHATLVITLSFTIPAHSSQQIASNVEPITPENAIAMIGGGIGAIVCGLLKLYNIPLTPQEEIALAAQSHMGEEQRKNLQFGRKLVAYPLISLGTLCMLGGIIIMAINPIITSRPALRSY